MTHYLQAPLINVNEEEMILVEWVKSQGAFVREGETIAVLETTKATSDLEADQQGYFVPLVEAGQEVSVGQAIAALTAQPDEEVHMPEIAEVAPAAEDSPPAETEAVRRWTKKAEIIARRGGIDVATIAQALPGNTVITEQDIEAYLANPPASKSTPPTRRASVDTRDLVDDVYGRNRIERVLILGGGDGAAQILDILARTPHQRAVAILDDNEDLHGKTIMGCPVVGHIPDITRLCEEAVFDAAIISIASLLDVRAETYDKYAEQGIPFTNAIDPSALILSNAEMGTGNAIMAFCQIAACTVIGNNNFISSYTSLEHHNVLASHCTFGPGVMTSGLVEIGNRVKFGTGIFIEPKISIGDDCIIASGAVLTKSVPADSIVKTKSNVFIRQRNT